VPSPQKTTAVYLSALRKSELVQPDVLMRILTELRRETGQAAVEDSLLAQRLLADGLVTEWQNERLLEGRHKGFFLGKHKLLNLLGAGGMSQVYLAEHTLMRRQVAIKVLPLARVNESSYLQRFFLEARAIASLDHPNIVQAYNVDNEGNVYYMVMQYIEGEDLSRLVKRDGPLAYHLAVNYIRQAAEGLEHAHGRGMIHRDIKPANLLLDKQGTVRILDMGVARLTGRDERSLTLEHNENVLGTTDYLAPEQAVDSHSVDHRADIYSLGCSLYFLLAGHPPFHEGTLAERLLKHQTDTPPDLRLKRPDIPEDLCAICSKLMEKKPANRYPTSGKVAEALYAWLVNHGYTLTGSGETRGAGQLSTAITSPSRNNVPRPKLATEEADAEDLPVAELLPDDTSISQVSLADPSHQAPPSKRPPAAAPAPARPAASQPASAQGEDAELFGFFQQIQQDQQAAYAPSPAPARTNAHAPAYNGNRELPYARRASVPAWVWFVIGALFLCLLVVVVWYTQQQKNRPNRPRSGNRASIELFTPDTTAPLALRATMG